MMYSEPPAVEEGRLALRLLDLEVEYEMKGWLSKEKIKELTGL
jgi:hypothetical protein